MEHNHYRKAKPIKKLLEEERKYLLALPDEDYPIFKEDLAKANKLDVRRVLAVLVESHSNAFN